MEEEGNLERASRPERRRSREFLGALSDVPENQRTWVRS